MPNAPYFFSFLTGRHPLQNRKSSLNYVALQQRLLGNSQTQQTRQHLLSC